MWENEKTCLHFHGAVGTVLIHKFRTNKCLKVDIELQVTRSGRSRKDKMAVQTDVTDWVRRANRPNLQLLFLYRGVLFC